MVTKNISRRKFLHASGLSGTVLLLGFYFPANAKQPKFVNVADEINQEIELNAWILINTSGKTTIMCHRAEMGQGAYQAISQIIAEELEVNLDDVNIVFAKGNNKKYGSQITGGSSTVRNSYKNLLKLSATAREMLIAAAATKWNVPATECYAEAGHIIHKPSAKKFHYGEVVVDASKLEAPKNVKLKTRSEYKLIGKPIHRPDTPLKTNGTAIFGIDKKLPGMLYASVERNPRLRGVVKNFDDAAARKVPGVKNVFKVRMKIFNTYREGVAVVATSTWAAMQGRKALKVEWDDSGFEHINNADVYQQHEDILKNKEGLVFKQQGDANNIISQAAKKLDVIYQTPYEAHAAIEPLNCVAHFQNDKIEIWGPIQAPDWVQQFISKEFNLPIDNVVVNMTFLGGGFGRKAFLDYPHEATLISKEMGAPVQVVWTREDDMTQGPFRPGMSYRCEGVVTDGAIGAFKIRLAGQNMDNFQNDDRSKPNDSAAEGFLKPYFDSIKNISIQDVPFETPVPVMWWRSVYASTNGFAYESFMDELAHEAGKDPLDFRRDYLQSDRYQAMLDKFDELTKWKSRGKNEGWGMAITECFGSPVAEAVKVSKNANGKVQIDKVIALIDCGWYVNPDIIRQQVEGAITMAIGAATIHETHFNDGMATEKNFDKYKMPRINNVPEIEVHIMENNELPGGVGEPGLPPLAPALCNAIFDLTGKRIRKLPFNLDEV